MYTDIVERRKENQWTYWRKKEMIPFSPLICKWLTCASEKINKETKNYTVDPKVFEYEICVQWVERRKEGKA
jgi:hypothetical protein